MRLRKNRGNINVKTTDHRILATQGATELHDRLDDWIGTPNSDILTVWWLNRLGERLPGSSSQEPNMTPLGGFFLSALLLNYTRNRLNKFINQVKLKDSCASAMSPLGQGNKNVIPTNVPSLTYFRFPFMAVWSSSLCNSRYRMPILWVWRTVIQRVFAQETLHDQLHSKHDGSWSGESLSEWML